MSTASCTNLPSLGRNRGFQGILGGMIKTSPRFFLHAEVVRRGKAALPSIDR